MERAMRTRQGLRDRLHRSCERVYFAIRDRLSPPERLLREVGLGVGWRVLDFGCGFGSFTLAAARQVGPDGVIYAIDQDEARVRHVAGLANRAGLLNIRARVSDCDTDIEAGTIDAVLLYDVFHCLPQPERVLAEVHRVLKPGGVLSFSDHHCQPTEVLSELTDDCLFEVCGTATRTCTLRKLGRNQ